MPSICFVEDSADYAAEVVQFLECYGFQIDWRDRIDGAFDWIVSARPDLVILDQFLPDGDSIAVLGRLRGAYFGGIVMLTGNQNQIDRILALEYGADAFVDKGRGLRELLAHIRATMRRIAEPDADRKPEGMKTRAWQIDRIRRRLVAPYGRAIELSPTEFDMLMYFHDHRGRVIKREELSNNLLRRSYSPGDRSIDNIISRIRNRLDDAGIHAVAISSVRGAGYLFTGLDGEVEDPEGSPTAEASLAST